MQRAAASSPLSATTTPDQHSAKRQKLSNGSATPTSTGTSTPILRDSSFARPEGGETEWILNLPKPVTNGHTSSSSEDDDPWHPSRSVGRQSYGAFKRRKTTVATSATNEEEDLSELESGEEEEDTHPLRPMKPSKDRANEEEAQGRRMDRMNLKKMGGGISGSLSTSGAKRKDYDGGKNHDRGKFQNRKKSKRGPDGKGSDGHGARKRKTI